VFLGLIQPLAVCRQGHWNVYGAPRPSATCNAMSSSRGDPLSNSSHSREATSSPVLLAIVETEPEAADRERFIRGFVLGESENALRVVSFNNAEGWSRDVSEEVAARSMSAYDADETLTDGTRCFIDRHVIPGEKRLPAPSARREQSQTARKKPYCGGGRSAERTRHQDLCRQGTGPRARKLRPWSIA
jgi:hypothetical protein